MTETALEAAIGGPLAEFLADGSAYSDAGLGSSGGSTSA
jgi:hypothetical protein